MQHNKTTDNPGEFQKLIHSDSKAGMCLEDLMISVAGGVRYFIFLLHKENSGV